VPNETGLADRTATSLLSQTRVQLITALTPLVAAAHRALSAPRAEIAHQRDVEGVSEDLSRHDRKRASCHQSKNQIQFQ
jgi:hypothetical protein